MKVNYREGNSEELVSTTYERLKVKNPSREDTSGEDNDLRARAKQTSWWRQRLPEP